MHSVKPFLMYGSWFQFYEGLLLLSFHKNLCLRNAYVVMQHWNDQNTGQTK